MPSSKALVEYYTIILLCLLKITTNVFWELTHASRTARTLWAATLAAASLATPSTVMATGVTVSPQFLIRGRVWNRAIAKYCYYLAEDDECINNPCQHICTNTVGSFTCDCFVGYELYSDGIHCHGEFIYAVVPNPCMQYVQLPYSALSGLSPDQL